VVVDALSRKYEEEGSLFSFILTTLDWLIEARQEWLENDTMVQLIQRLQEDPIPPKGYTW
jgi:hypothetical protein